MNKRDIVLSLVDGQAPAGYVPAAFFLHFDPAFHRGQAAIDKHLEFFRMTGMDFVKIQYEQKEPAVEPIRTPADWARVPHCSVEHFAPTIQVVEGLVKAAKREAVVILTLYSPFMWARHMAEESTLSAHLREDPDAVAKGLAILTENVINLVRGCKQVGVDGFYASTQGGEATRFPGTDIFRSYIRPTDLAVWDELSDCAFNILHVCDYVSGYDDLTPFLDYPGHVVNCSLRVGQRMMSPREASALFDRPFMGGLERKGVLATGPEAEIRAAAEAVLAEAPDRFILAADCTVPGDTPWHNLKTAIDTAHGYLST
jgi:uroporphyrinogen decarboxylase